MNLDSTPLKDFTTLLGTTMDIQIEDLSNKIEEITDINIWKEKTRLSILIFSKDIVFRNNNMNAYNGGMYELGINSLLNL